MKKKSYIYLIVIILVLLVAPPILAPVVHSEDSAKSAIRYRLYQDGHPYQSFTAMITDKQIKDQKLGQMYDVSWIDWNNQTGQTANICYSKKENDKYKVTCGTGP